MTHAQTTPSGEAMVREAGAERAALLEYRAEIQAIFDRHLSSIDQDADVINAIVSGPIARLVATPQADTAGGKPGEGELREAARLLIHRWSEAPELPGEIELALEALRAALARPVAEEPAAPVKRIAGDKDHILAVGIYHAMNGDPSLLRRLVEEPAAPRAGEGVTEWKSRSEIAKRLLIAFPDLTMDQAECAAENAFPECLLPSALAAAPKANGAGDGGDGWRLAPVEPTEEMLAAGINPHPVCRSFANDVYRAMLAAAPVLPGKGD